MSTLHLLSRPLPEAPAQHCLDASQPGDAILLLGQALLTDPLPDTHQVLIYAREAELSAIGHTLIRQACEAIDDDQFVELTETHQTVASWY